MSSPPPVYGLAYSLKLELDGDGPPAQVLTAAVTATYVVSDGPTEGRLRRPHTWRWRLQREEQRYGISITPGASEVWGLLGGVRNESMLAASEFAERSIGDALTTLLTEILTELGSTERATVVVFGPAFPKIVGRFASLRPASGIHIVWLCPPALPEWIISQSAGNAVTIPAAPLDLSDEDWDTEALVRVFEHTCEDGSMLAVQELVMYGGDQDTAPQTLQKALALYPWLKEEISESYVPRELALAIDQVERHVENPYSGSAEEEFGLSGKNNGIRLRVGDHRAAGQWSIAWE